MVRGVPLKTDPHAMAHRLRTSEGLEAALKRVKDELILARRARSRHRYAYWAAVGEALGAEAERSAAPYAAAEEEARAS
jgi:hypothetical protein